MLYEVDRYTAYAFVAIQVLPSIDLNSPAEGCCSISRILNIPNVLESASR